MLKHKFKTLSLNEPQVYEALAFINLTGEFTPHAKRVGQKIFKTPSSSLVRTQAFQACSTGSNPVGVAFVALKEIPSEPFVLSEKQGI